jgi:hypothetical protein
MRSETESERIHLLTCELLKSRGIEPTKANYDEYTDASLVAAEAFERSGENATTAEMLAGAAQSGAVLDKRLAPVLAKFAVEDGKFVGDLSLTEQELLEAAIAAEEQKDAVVAAEAGAYCPTCGEERLFCEY